MDDAKITKAVSYTKDTETLAAYQPGPLAVSKNTTTFNGEMLQVSARRMEENSHVPNTRQKQDSSDRREMRHKYWSDLTFGEHNKETVEFAKVGN